MIASDPVTVRPARKEDYAAAADVTVRAYRSDGFTGEDYVPHLASVAARARVGDVLVAIDDAGSVIGAVAAFTASAGPEWAEQAEPGDVVLRMLAVDPAARRAGVGRKLTEAVVARARDLGARRVVLSSQPEMVAAHALYLSLGFQRVPERDWRPFPELLLWAFVLEVSEPDAAAAER